MQQLEALQRSFTSHISEVSHLDYWDRLTHLKLYSIERRFERYLVIYAWKIMEKMVVQPETFEIANMNSRTGRKFIFSNSNRASKFCELPFYRAKRVFNCLPRELRNITAVDVESFKYYLDKYLSKIPDEPNVTGYKKFRACATNSIHDQIPYLQSGDEAVTAPASPLS